MAERGLLSLLKQSLSGQDEDLSPEVSRTTRAARRSGPGLADLLMGAAKGYTAGAGASTPELGFASGALGGFETAQTLGENRRKAAGRVRIPKRIFGLDEDGEFEFENGKDAADTLSKFLDKRSALTFEERLKLLERGNELKGETKKPQKPLPPSAMKELSSIGDLSKALTVIKQDYNPSFVGLADATMGRVKQFTGVKATPERARFYQNLNKLKNTILNLRSGAAITAQEAARLIRELPSEARSDVDFEAGLDNFETTLNSMLGDRKKLYESQGYSVDTISPQDTNPAKQQQGGVPSFATAEEAEASGYKGEAMIGGRKAVIE